MEIQYSNKNVRKILLSHKEIQRKVGNNIGKTIIKRIEQLRATKSLYEYIMFIKLGSPHHLKGNMNKYLSISITGNYRLIIEPLETKLDLESLKCCSKIDVKGVLDYHGGREEWIIP